jgi:protein tyrosine phosphatase
VANAEHVDIDDIKNDIVCNFGPQPPSPDNFWDLLIKTLEKYKYQISTITVIVITMLTVYFVIKTKK